MTKATPNWQPLSALPMMAAMVSEQLADVRQQLQTLQSVQSRPHVLDDAIVKRLLQVYGEQQDFLWVYDEQVMRWQREALTPDQHQRLESMAQQLVELNSVLSETLAMAEAFQGKTIDSILSKSDIELAVELLSGDLQPPS
ncbi:MAG: hypothetical protein AAFY20_13300 [Cyanobacteria bacterium J06639_14]